MTKYSAKELGVKVARETTDITSKTAHQLEAIEYQERNRMLSQMADVAVSVAATMQVKLDDKSTPIFRMSFIETGLALWAQKLKQLRVQRDSFRQASSGITSGEADSKVQDIVKSFNLRGANLQGGYHGSVEVRRGDDVQATLYIRWDREDDIVENPDNPNHRVWRYRMHTELSWAGTSRSIAVAVANVKLYQELIELAAELEAVMGRERVISIWGAPEAAEVEAK
jgi:hypothetical protein